MSFVTNVLLKISAGDKSRISKLNELFQSDRNFISCDDDSLPRGWYAGTKILECEVYPRALTILILTDLLLLLTGMIRRAYSYLFKRRKKFAWQIDLNLALR